MMYLFMLQWKNEEDDPVERRHKERMARQDAFLSLMQKLIEKKD